MSPAIELEGVTFAYPRAERPALQGVSLRINTGERLGILGPNGGGKSTLLKLILGVLTPSAGVVRVLGATPRAARATGAVGYVAQRSEAELGFPLTVREVVTLGVSWRLAPWRSVPRAMQEQVARTLQLVGAQEFADRPIGRLSGGQLQRALVARALVGRPRILVLDEPTVGIDAAGQEQFARLLTDVHRATGVTLLIVSHDIRAVAAGCDRVACLARTLHYHASPQGLTPQVLAEVFSHDIAGLIGAGPLAGMHLHAHGATEACPLTISAPARSRADDGGGPTPGGAAP